MGCKVVIEKAKVISALLVAIIVIVALVGKIYSTDDNHYVLDVVKENATSKDDNLQVTEKILKGENEQYFDSKELDYEVELKNISQPQNVETQVAIVIDSSYSMELNDANNVVKSKAIELAKGIRNNVKNSRISISNNSGVKLSMATYSDTQIKNAINSLVIGEENDSNQGLNNANSTFKSATNSANIVNKYIVVFTDATDDVTATMESIAQNNPDVKIISILLDMTSNSYIVDGTAVYGDVYLLLSEVIEDDVAEDIQLLDLQKIYDEMNRAVNNITVSNEFSDEILTYFDISELTTSVGTAEKTETGYTWNVDKIKNQATATLKFKLTLKTNVDIDAGIIFNELYTNKEQNIKYQKYNSVELIALNGTDSREETESTVIKICQGYDLKIKAVNESNKDLEVPGVEFKVVGTNEEGNEICNLTKITDSDGYITITAEEARALRVDGTITFSVTPSVDLVGYSRTDTVQFSVTNDKVTRNLSYDDYESGLVGIVTENKRLVEITVPINSQRVDFELRVEELNNSDITISGAEFELIQPKLNNKYEMEVLNRTSDENGIMHFSPTVMTKDGSYNYILRQISAPDNYDVTAITLITIKFENGIVKSISTQFNENVNTEICRDKENHVLIRVGNECVEKDPFDLQINLSDINSGDKLEGVTYLITTTNANNQVRNEYVVTDENGEINTKVYGNGNLNVKITEQSPKVGYVADTKAKEVILNRNNGVITIWHADPEITQSGNKDNIIVNLYSQKKTEQNIVRVSLVDAQEQDVAVGAGVVYELLDVETGYTYSRAVSDKKGELSFTIDAKEEGQHMFRLIVDDETIPEEYDESSVESEINFNLVFEQSGYIQEENVVNDETVIDDHFSVVNNDESVEYTAFIKIGYEMEVSNTTEFKIQLSDHEDLSEIEGASYNVDIEWDINGTTRTKTINGRKTNLNGEITTRIFKGEETRIYVTQVGAAVGYTVDNTTQEIYLTFNNNGTTSITQTPYDLGQTNTEEPNQGAYEQSGTVIYKHLNRKRTSEDTYVNITINKMDTNGAYVNGVIVNIKSDDLADKNDTGLDLIMRTGEQGSDGTITIDYAEYLKDMINNETIRVPNIGQGADEIVYELEISELQLQADSDGSTDYSTKSGTTVKLRLIFRYKDNRVTLTNVETIYGNRLVKNKTFSSSSDNSEGQELEDSLGVYLSNITLDLYTNYDDIGNLSLDFKKQNEDEEELVGARYSLKITNPDATVIRKEIEIKNGEDSSDIEISGVSVNVGSLIELTEIKAPVGYGINSSTEILEVVEISDDGEITLEHKEPSYDPNRLILEKETPTMTSSGNIKTNYQITFVDYQLDTFEFEITAKDNKTKEGVEGFGFKIDSSKGSTKTLMTYSSGYGKTKVGGNIENNTITYTISAIKLADYYKPLSSLIKVNVVFDEFGNVDVDATIAAQTDSGYGRIWTISTLETYGKIGIQILVEHQDPLVVKVATIDKATNAKIQDVSYKITESEELPATGTDNIEVGYALQKGMRTYTISQVSIKNSYADILEKTFTITYDNAILTDATLTSAETLDTIKITGNKEVTITIYVEPKVPFEITNLYYFNTDTKLQGSNFEIISQRNEDVGTGTTDANGMTGIYSDTLGTNEEIIYNVRQTKGAIGYATVEDFYVKVTFNKNREITKAELVNQYGNIVTDNRVVTVGFVKTSTYSTYNSNDKGIVTIQVLNYPEFKIVINDVDRRDGTTPIVGTEYSVKSTYTESDGTVVDFTSTEGVLTNSNGIGTAHLDKTKDNTVVTYTVSENVPAAGYQSLGTDIKVVVTFDENGYVHNVQVEDDSNLSKIESASKIDPVVNPEDNFVVNLQLKNNPILKFNLTAMDGIDHSVKIKDIGFQIVSKTDDGTLYSNSSATNRVNQTEDPETSYTDVNGYTASYLDRTLDNKDMYYTIKEVQKAPGYEWADKEIVIKVSYDSNGKISTITPVQGGELISITEYDTDNFEINIDIYNDEIKEFGIHLTAADTYDIDKKLNNMKVEAFLVETGNNSYVSDGKYELVGENALLTGEDRNNDGKPDLAYGEDYKTIGPFEEITEGEITRTLRLVIKNDSIETSTSGNATTKSGYYLDSCDGTNNGKNVGYYKGTTYYPDAEYQTVKYQYLINVTFDSDGKIKSARLQTGFNGFIGWLTDGRYIEVDENGYLSHTDYRLNITMKFYPMFDLNLNAMDNYTYLDEINTNGKPIALEGTKYTISTARHYTGRPREYDEFVTAGYIGYGNTYGWNGSYVQGDIYENTDRLLVPIENSHTRTYFIFEESEPNNYQKYTDRYFIGYWEQKLVAVFQVTFDEYGEIDYDNSILRKVDESATEYTIKPYMDEAGTSYLSSNNIQEYNYWYRHEASNRDIDFYIGYSLTTKINVTAIDDISGNAISNIRMTPFINNTYCTDTSYEYNTVGYRDTDTNGQFSVKYWGAATQNSLNQYIIGSSRIGNAYNGYFFPSDMANEVLGGSGNEDDYYTKLDITYGNDGKISNVQSIGTDLWGENNVVDITWDSETGNVYINMVYSRKFQVTLNKVDYYDGTINDLEASFDAVSNRGLTTSINAKKMTPLGKIYKDTTVKYTLSETQIPEGYYPITETIDMYVTFDENGNIGTNTVKSSSDYFELVNTTDNTERSNKGTPDLTINIKNKPAFNLDLRIIDKFYKDDGISDLYLKVINDKGDVALGNPQTDKNGYAKVVTGPVYPGETVKFYISQTNTATGYYENTTTIELEVEFNDVGKVEDYKILAGNEVINEFSPDAYINTRDIVINIMNMTKDLKIGLYKYDKTTNEPMAGVKFTITGVNLNSNATVVNKQIITGNDGIVIETIDTFDTSLSGKTIKYTIHEDETPASYRTMEDIVFIIRYNADGSIASCNQVENDNGVLTDVVPQIAIGRIKYLNDERVHFLVNTPNDNAYDIIIKNEDTNYAGLGIEGSQFDVSVNGTIYTPELTDSNGKTTIKDLTQSGDITIKIAQKSAGEGYRFDVENTVEVNVEKGIEIYSLDLNTTTDGYVDDKNATTTKAIVEVDETYGTITVTFKNETKTELTIFKQDINSKVALKDAELEVIAQQIDSTGNNIGDATKLTTEDNKITDVNGQLYFDLGVSPQSQIWEYTFKEITPPEGYNALVDLAMTITYDQYGRISEQETSRSSRLNVMTATDNYNCHSMYAIIYSGDVSPAYTLKVVTEDADTGKRINGSNIYINITDEMGDLITVEAATEASAENGRISQTGNLGIDGQMYTDEELDAEDSNAPIIIEKGLTYIDNIDYEGIINVEVSQKETADGYIFGKQKTDGNIQINTTYVPHLDDDPTVEFTVMENDGFDIIVDNTNRMITIKMLNESQVLFNITTKQYGTENTYIQGVNYNITAEIQTAVDSILTDLNETTPLSDENGQTKGNVGSAYAGKTIVYTLHQNTLTGYKAIDDIQIEVKYDSRGYIKFYEMLSSEDNAYIDEGNTTGRTISLVVQNRKVLSEYKVSVEKHAMDTDDDEGAYSKLLAGAKFRINVNQENSGVESTTWLDVTDENGYIDGLTFNGFGYITITLEEVEAPEGYELNTLKKLRIYRDQNTGEIEEVNGDINFTHNEDYTEVCLKPVDNQLNNKFTLIINKYSTATNKYITDDQTEFKAELIKKDENDNIIYQNTIENIYTNKNGKAIIDNQDMPGEEGEYKLVITELKAPEGYVGLSDAIEIPVIFERDLTGSIVIKSVNVEGLENVSVSKVNKQLIGINIGNDVDIEIKEDEYSLDITKVDSETGEAIEDMAIFKVWLPDENNTAVYTETKTTLLGPGKLDYCYIEQDKDYTVRLTHMKKPEQAGSYVYKFKEIVAPEGYTNIDEELGLTIEFSSDTDTGELYISNVISSNEKYLKVNTITPCTTDTQLSIDILNYSSGQNSFTVHYDANDNGEGTTVPVDQRKEKDVDLTLDIMEPTRQGYIFKGWATLPSSTTADFNAGDTYTLNQDITLYAVWEENLYLKSTEYVISNENNYVEDAKLEENIYKDTDTYILGINPKLTIETGINEKEWTKGTKIADFKNSIQTNADTIKLYDESNNEITDSDSYLGTGMIIEFIKGNQNPIRLTIIAQGDINGDGILNLNDITKAKRYIKKDEQSILDNIAKRLAFDTNMDGRLNMKDANNMQRAQSNDDIREINS